MLVLQITLLIVGLIALVIGYRRTNRNVLLFAALTLLAAGAVSEFVTGFNDGRAGRGMSHAAPAD
jgi:hypothetical protein